MLASVDTDLDDGPRTEKSATMRMCAVTRAVRPIDELIRFVVSPDGTVVPDLKRKLPGRGLWVSASRAQVAEAVRRNQFSRGFKRDIRASKTLPEDTESLIAREGTKVFLETPKCLPSARLISNPETSNGRTLLIKHRTETTHVS